ncbi:response regulator [Maritalea porphyrae]|uniref:Response regulatory domain-containing protein n=1 Tax=Maritalea porphyrae TaxID=880732 RepID=A0ABQ5UQM6_9HYPH|nr:response regulator [Maritalea porphyrae]GLQ17488.1 hypothetical protein GCM10007879_17370 [Maritalea porphyrae]
MENLHRASRATQPKPLQDIDREQLSCFLLDDDHIDIGYLTHQLGAIEHIDFDIVTARNLEDAQRIVDNTSFDLYLVDFWLSSETAVPIISKLASSQNRKAIVVLSTLEEATFQEMGLRAGAAQFLSKQELTPFNLESCIRSARSFAMKAEALDEKLNSYRASQAKDLNWLAQWTESLVDRLMFATSKNGEQDTEVLEKIHADLTTISHRLRIFSGQNLEQNSCLIDANQLLEDFTRSMFETPYRVVQESPFHKIFVRCNRDATLEVLKMVAEFLHNSSDTKGAIQVELSDDQNFGKFSFRVRPCPQLHDAHLELSSEFPQAGIKSLMSNDEINTMQAVRALLQRMGGSLNTRSEMEAVIFEVAVPSQAAT